MEKEFAMRIVKNTPWLEIINCALTKILGTQKFTELKRRWGF
jgi:hypothetical protein